MTIPTPPSARLARLYQNFFRRPSSTYLVLLVLTLLMFADVLVPGRTVVLGNRDTDVFLQFLAWRSFGFGELAQGHLALWNPHVFSGAPYFGGFQAALLYPPNWLFMVMPTPLAINWSIALHVFLMGAFMNAWALRRGMHPAAACLTGVLLMFCGPYFLHIYAGHLTNLCAMVWAPLVFLAIDELFECAGRDGARPADVAGWCLLGCMAVNLQVLAGHPQYVFYTAVAAAVYCALRLLHARRRGAIVLWLAVIPAGGMALAAVQMIAGVVAASETVRSKALTYKFASMFSLPPENLLTLFAPGLFGDLPSMQYFGRGYLWETSAYIGVTACVLAVYGALRSNAVSGRRMPLQMALMVCILVVLALGANTPMFQVLYSLVPGFDRFRGMAKFVFPAAMFMAMLAGLGFDRLLRTRRPEGGLVGAALLAGAVLLVVAVGISQMDWLPVLERMARTGESYLLPRFYGDPALAQQFSAVAAHARARVVVALLVAGTLALLLGGLLLGVRRKPGLVWLVGALALLEVFVFAAASRDTFDSLDIEATGTQDFLKPHEGDYRIANTLNPNAPMAEGASDLWGNDPGVVRRYAELLAFVQGKDPDKADQYLDFTKSRPMYSLLRLRFIFGKTADGQLAVNDVPDPMPAVALLGRYRHAEGRDAVFAAMRDPAFDFRKEVILETEPNPVPADNPEGQARVTARTTDALTVEVETTRPAVLLMTDVYTPSWQARALPGSAQQAYDLLPADYALRAIPLAAGKHRILVEYRPKGLALGAWVSGLSLLVWLGAAGWVIADRRRFRPG